MKINSATIEKQFHNAFKANVAYFSWLVATMATKSGSWCWCNDKISCQRSCCWGLVWLALIASLCNEDTAKIISRRRYFCPLNCAKCLWDLVTRRPLLLAFCFLSAYMLVWELLTNCHFDPEHLLSLLFFQPLVMWWPHSLAFQLNRHLLHWVRSFPACCLPSLILSLTSFGELIHLPIFLTYWPILIRKKLLGEKSFLCCWW